MMDWTGRELYEEEVRAAVARALDEDRAGEDVTTLAVVPEGAAAEGRVLFRSGGVVAGTVPFDESFRAVDRSVRVKWERGEGERAEAGETVCRVRGAASSLLRGERAALNFLMRLSGIATFTARFVDAVRGTDVEILDTRKTTPGLRVIEKFAVRAGGGTNHRMDLSALALIKENHIQIAGGIAAAVGAVRARSPKIAVEVEVENLEQLEEALALGVERIMLDNFDIAGIKEAVRRVRSSGVSTYIELSGGVDLERAAEAAPLGVNGISIGALTHSAPAADFSFLFESSR